jgi:hypothetical protein
MTRPTSTMPVTTMVILFTLSIGTLRGSDGPNFVEISMDHSSGKFAGVAMGDVDQDGYAEILVGQRNGQEGLFFFSFKDGKWTRKQITSNGEYGGVALADISGDKILDIIAVKTKGRPKGLELFQTRLVGREPRFEPMASPFTEAGCDDVAVGDIESDGDLDIAVSTGGKGVQVLLNEGNGMSFEKLHLETNVYEDTGVAMGDVNGDGRLDVISANHPGKALRLFLCNRAGKVNYSSAYTEGLPGAAIGYRIAVVDLNGDTLADLAVGSSRAGMRLFFGNGCQGPESTWWTEGRIAVRASQTMQVSVGDLNRDDKPDLVFSSQRGVAAVLNRGTGAFSPRLSVGLPEKGNYAGCCLFDWDNDRDLDVVCTGFQGEGIRFFENQEN